MENFLSDNQTVGTILRQEREKQHKTIQDVAQATHIRGVFLEFLEADNFDELPSKLHITGFLKVYSQYLGLDEREILTSYKKQMLLLQDLPLEEIFTISNKSSSKKKKKILIYLLILCVILFIVIFWSLFSHQKVETKQEIRLSASEPKQFITVSRGEEFSFTIKEHKVNYRLVDFTDKTITLSNLSSQMNIPPFLLYLEALEYDLDEDGQTYDYLIQVVKTAQDKVTFAVSFIDVLKNPGQLSYAIIRISDERRAEEENQNQMGMLTIQNTSSSKMFIATVDMKRNVSKIELNPMQTQKIPYFDDQKKPQYTSIYIQDADSIRLLMDGEEVVQGQLKKGAIGIITCDLSRLKENYKPVCRINTGNY